MLSLDWNLLFTIINLLIWYLLIKKFLVGPICKMMDKRAEMIKGQFDDASSTEAKANELKAQYEDALRGAKDESAAIIEKARTDAKQQYDLIVTDAGTQADKLKKDAQKAIEQDKTQALREMELQIAGLAMTAAEKIVASGAGKEGDQALYDSFFEEAGDASDTDKH